MKKSASSKNRKSNFTRVIGLSAIVLVAAIFINALPMLKVEASDGSFFGLANLFSWNTVYQSAIEPQMTVESDEPLVIGTCDTAGPIEVESTGGTTAPTPYATLKLAFDAIIAGTHTGSINIEVCGNTTETATAALTASGLTTTSYTDITIRPVGGARIIEGSIVGAIIRLNGADNVTIDGRQGGAGVARDLTVRNNNTSAATATIWLSSGTTAGTGATGNTIRNLEIAAGAPQNTSTNSTFGIIMSGTTISVSDNGVDNDNNSFIANRIIKARYGIVTRGTTTNLSINPIVTDNIVGPSSFGADQIGKVGIFMQADTGALVSRNTVQFVGGDFANTTSGTDRVGIGIGQESWSTAPSTLTSNTYTITKNIIHDIIEERTFSSVGLLLGTTGGGSPTNNLVANNFIYNVKSNGTGGDQTVGLGISGGHTDSVVFNSLSLTGDVDPNASASATTNYGSGIRIGNASSSSHANLTLMNNSVYLDLSSSSTAAVRYYAISGPSNAYSFGTGGENYNNYYINPANPQLQTGGLGTASGNTLTTQFATLVNWRTAYTTPQDANSIQANPQYVSPTSDLHIQPTSPNESAGTTIIGVTDDIDGQVRPNGPTPDIGADEIAQPVSPGILQFSSATYSGREGNTVTVTVNRSGGSAGTVTVDYATVAGGTATGGASCGGAVDYVTTMGTLTFANGVNSQTFTIQLCTDSLTKGSETINLQLSNTTGGATIGTQSTATVTIIDVVFFTGSVNVGAGETFTSLTNPGGLFEALNNGIVEGNTTINITSDLTSETGAVALNQLTEQGAGAGTYTLTIKPNGAARTISGTGAIGLIRLSDADRVTIDGSLTGGTAGNTVGGDATLRNLTIQNNNTSTSSAVIVIGSNVNGAQNNTIKNVIVNGNAPTTTLVGISLGGAAVGTAGVDNDNNRVENSAIRRAVLGIYSAGASSANQNTGTVITKNDMTGTTTERLQRIGIVLFNDNGAQVSLNSIGGLDSAASADSIGIGLGAGTQDAQFSNTAATNGGISNAVVERNRISGVAQTNTWGAAGIAVAGDTTGANTIRNNMISGVITNSTSPDIGAGIFVAGVTGSVTRVYFNSVAMTGDRGATASQLPSYAIAITGTDPTVELKNNIFYNSQIAGVVAAKSYAIGMVTTTFANLDSNYNDFFTTGANSGGFRTGSLAASAGTDHVNLAAWQMVTGDDANSKEVDPLFVNPVSDLHLQPTSPLINMGTPIAGITTDIDGDARHPLTPDIGVDQVTAFVNPTVQFSSATYMGAEGTTATITVTRTGDTTVASTVAYATSNGTATGGATCGGMVDYENASGTLNFAIGESSKTFNVVLCSDAFFKGDETVNLTLSMPSGATLGTPSTAVLTISNISPGTLQLSAATYTVAENVMGGTVTVTVNRTNGTNGAVAVNYTLSGGTATGGAMCGMGVDYVNTGGTVNFADGQTSQTFTVQICDDAVFEGNETFNVTLSMPTGGASIGMQSSATVTITDNEVAQPGTLALSASTYSVAENVMGGTVTITVNRTGGTDGAVGATYALSNGTATGGAMCGAGVDFVNTGGTISFANGEASKTFTVTICNDTVFEGNETFNVTLSTPTGGATLGMPTTAVVTITDDEVAQPGTLALSSATYSVAENVMGGTVTITVNRTGGTDGAVAVNYNLTDGTATGGAMCGGAVDFVNNGGTVNFANGETTKTFTVTICDDTVFEGNETFNVTLSTPTGGATLGMPTTAVVTINDNEVAQPGAIALSASTYSVVENVMGGTLTIPVTRTGGTDGAVGVTYALSDGTATGGAMCGAGIDFVNTGGTVNFANGVNSANITVTICDDAVFEGNETFNVTLSMPTGGATLGMPTTAVVTITDNEVAQPGVLALSASTYSVAENVMGGTVTITVNRTGGTDGAVAVNYNLTDGTATGGAMCGAGIDFVNTGGTISFANGEASKTFTVTICNDATVEGNETFTVTLSGATGGATIGTPSSAVITITDDDVAPAGNVVVNPGNVSYATLKEAFDAINAGTHTGAVTIGINANLTETASAVLNASGSGGANYTSVVITPIGGVARTIEGTIVGSVIKLNGADNVTIDGRIGGTGRNLTVRNNSTATATAAIWLASIAAGNGASNNVIRNLEIAAGASANVNTSTTIGVYMGGTTISLTSTDGNDNDNNQFIANRITRARYGLATRGVTTNNNEGLVITDNIVGPEAFGADEIGKVGIYLQADTGAIVSRNTVQYVGGNLANTTAGADRCGICIGGESWGQTESTVITSGDYTVTKNNVHDVVEERTFSAVGIRLGTTRSGMPTNNLVANNFIYNIRSNATAGDQVAGIGYAAGHTDRIVYNSISLTGDMDPGTATSSSIYGNAMRVSTVNGTNNANLTMMNNSIYVDVNSNTAANRYFAITLPAATYTFGTGGLNYNNYYINQANPQLRTGGVGVTSGNSPGTVFQTLADWQMALTPPQDANSKQADPLYFSPTSDLHIQSTSPNVDMATPIMGITDDIDSQIRPNGAAPDIGADEFYPAPGSVQFGSPTFSATEVSGTATITVTRAGGASGAISVDYATVMGGTAVGGASCTMGIDYVNTSGTLMWADNDFAPKTFTVTICNDGIFKGAETVNLALSNPTGGATLGTPSTAVLTILNSTIFSGPVNVGTGEAYTSLTNPGGLFEAINNGGLSANVTVNITSDLTAETGAIALNQFSGGFTLTIQPVGARVISGGSATVLLDFNGADGVTINGLNSGGNSLTIRNTTTGTGTAVRFINDASNNSVLNTTLEGGGTSSVLFISTGVTTGNDNITVTGNTIRDRTDATSVPFNSINLIGTSATISNTNILISNNQIINFAQAGLLVANSDNVTFTVNEIFQTAARTTGLFGVAVNSMTGTNLFSQNTIRDLTTSLATTGLQFNDVRDTTVSRNRIFNFPSTSGSTGALTGIVFNGVSGAPASLSVVNNMISIIPNFNNNQIIRGIYDFGFDTNVFTSHFNSVLIGGTNTGVASSWACVRGTGAPTTHTMSNNICFNNRTGGTGNNFAAGDQTNGGGTFTSNYNIFVGTGATAANFFDKGTVAAGTPVDFATWQAGPPPRDANSQASNPSGNYTVANMFVSPTDLHLNMSGTNPAFNAGTPVMGVTIDFDGQTRDSAPDIGADEVVVAAGILSLSSSTYSVNEDAGTVTVTVNRAGTTGAVSVNYTLSNGTATGGAMCGAGIDYVNTGGTVSFADGQASQTFTVQVCNDTLDETNETFNVTLSGATGGAIIGSPNTATVTITDNDPTPSLSISDVSQAEGNMGTTNFVFTVTLSAASGQVVTVDYATADGTATAGSDYTAITTTTLTFAPGETMKQITVSVNGDTVVEPNETFFVNLTNATNATISDNQGLGTIVNDDSAPGQLSINDVSVTEGNSGTRTATFTVTLVPGSGSNPVTVQYATANGTATSGSDYVATSGTLTFNPGTTTQTINVTINGDNIKEANETFFVNLSNPTNAIITDGQGIGIIIDDDRAVVADFDGDRKTDFSVFRPSNGYWYVVLSTSDIPISTLFGLNGDIPVPGDYDGDGRTDHAVWRPSTGIWYVQQSSNFAVIQRPWGISTDRPVQGDYDGDAKTDYAVYRDGIFYVIRSSDNVQIGVTFGAASDIPVQGDYDGDAKTDYAVYRPSTGAWYVQQSSNGAFVSASFGASTDRPIVGDFDGDGRADFSVYRGGVWYILQSQTGSVRSEAFGAASDIPTAGDYDADGKTDIAVFRPSTGAWYIRNSSDNSFTSRVWGTSGDIPIPTAYQTPFTQP